MQKASRLNAPSLRSCVPAKRVRLCAHAEAYSFGHAEVINRSTGRFAAVVICSVHLITPHCCLLLQQIV